VSEKTLGVHQADSSKQAKRTRDSRMKKGGGSRGPNKKGGKKRESVLLAPMPGGPDPKDTKSDQAGKVLSQAGVKTGHSEDRPEKLLYGEGRRTGEVARQPIDGSETVGHAEAARAKKNPFRRERVRGKGK